MKKLLLASSAVALAALLAAVKLSRAGYESAEYRVELEDGAFEIREYPSLLLASTSVPGRDDRGDDGFRRLFRYISGANAAETRIAMTTPVLMTEGDDGSRMSFIAPRDLAVTGAPAATDQQVQIETMDGGRFAAFRFRGRWNPAGFGDAEQQLIDWTRQQGLETVGQPIAAGYDPPFTPPFLRRNEVLIRLAG